MRANDPEWAWVQMSCRAEDRVERNESQVGDTINQKHDRYTGHMLDSGKVLDSPGRVVAYGYLCP